MQRIKSFILPLIICVVGLCVLVVWIAFSWPSLMRQVPEFVTLEERVALPHPVTQEQVDEAFQVAREASNNAFSSGNNWRRGAIILGWIGAGITLLITGIGILFGARIVPNSSGASVDPNETRDLVNKHAPRYTAIISILAFISVCCTGGADLLRSQSTTFYTHSDNIYALATEARNQMTTETLTADEMIFLLDRLKLQAEQWP